MSDLVRFQHRETTRTNRFLGTGSRLRHRGTGTAKGGFGYCRHCRRDCPGDEGPDVCLGIIPGVNSACCGHGGACKAYLDLDGVHIEGDEALAWFDEYRGRKALGLT